MSTLFGKTKRKRRAYKEVKEGSTEDAKVASLAEQSNRKKNDDHVDASSGDDGLPSWASFDDLGLSEPLVTTCRQLGFKRPTPVQRTVIPFLLQHQASHLLALASTGSGKTAAFVLPIIQRLQADPYGIYAVVMTPTRELAKQIHQQVIALGSVYNVTSTLVVGGLDAVRQACELDNRRPHFCVATPGRLAELLRGPKPPRLKHVRYMVLDEADRLLAANSGFERDVAELLLHCTTNKGERRTDCQTLLFSATMTRSLESVEEMAGAGRGRLPLKKFVIGESGEDAKVSTAQKATKRSKVDSPEITDEDIEDGTELDSSGNTTKTPKIPAGLKQEYIFMPSRVRDAYLLATLRALLANGGRPMKGQNSGWALDIKTKGLGDDDGEEVQKARSAIVFVSSCERAAFVSGVLSEVGVENVALHSLLSQNRRLASLEKFKSQQVRVLVATDVASRGLDIPTVDLVVNCELPRNAVSYVHRVGRTARAGRRGRAISLVAEADVGLVHSAEKVSGRQLEKCTEVTDEMAVKLLGPVTKAARLTKMKLMDIGFDELVQKFKERKRQDRKDRDRLEARLRNMAGK